MLIFGAFSFIAGLTRSPWWYVLLIWLTAAFVLYSQGVVGHPAGFPYAAALVYNFLFYGLGRGAAYAWVSFRRRPAS